MAERSGQPSTHRRVESIVRHALVLWLFFVIPTACVRDAMLGGVCLVQDRLFFIFAPERSRLIVLLLSYTANRTVCSHVSRSCKDPRYNKKI